MNLIITKLLLPSQAVASKLHGTEVEVEILQSKCLEEGADHVQFLISDKKTEQSAEELMINTDALTMTNFPFLSQGRLPLGQLQ